MDKQQEFKNITTKMSELYSKKNHDYGDAFSQTFAELGIISAITRISDKTNRLKSLATKDQRVDDEKIEDTLMDLANYAVMTLIELRDNDDKQPIETVTAYSDGGPVFSTELLTKPIAGVYKGKVYKGRWNLLKDLKHDGFEWFARDENSELYAFKGIPKKYKNIEFWDTGANDYSLIKKDNFPQIKWTDNEPTSIESTFNHYYVKGR
ncbi:DUF1599 domain-containing protein [Aerococcus urinaeequi]|uniref:DUF1599 domain-containing protein n=1 Tax=Aerococcus urinaeequi TaxID=51665 RepID=A0AAE9XGM7_9LACT|nr:DUF1599 domain-containing protein [Aerococcus urinaeequi]WCG37069.1 DUF1599 domain-containing protein [Aerococcus urinaeequi]